MSETVNTYYLCSRVKNKDIKAAEGTITQEINAYLAACYWALKKVMIISLLVTGPPKKVKIILLLVTLERVMIISLLITGP